VLVVEHVVTLGGAYGQNRVTFIVLVAYATIVYALLSRRLVAELDDRVRDDYEAAENAIDLGPDGSLEWPVQPVDADDQPSRDHWVEVRTLDGTLVHEELPNLPGKHSLPTFSANELGARAVDLAPDLHVRVYSAKRQIGSHAVVISAARSDQSVRQELADLWIVLGLGLPIAVGLASLGGYLIARRALSPLSSMASRARDITAERLHERLSIARADDELGQLATVFNETFERLEKSFEQLKRFTSDASHELRTPLAALRAVGEVGLSDGASPEKLRETVSSMLEEADRLTRLVDALLHLARADTGRIALKKAPIDLYDVAEDAAAQLGVLADERSQSLKIQGTKGTSLDADRVLMKQAVLNLLDNAIAYGPPSSEIVLAVETTEGWSEISVSDHGPGIPVEQQARIFERFYRVDDSRARDQGGFGLGLAIAKWSVEAHGGTLTLESAPGDGSTFRIRLPRAA